MDKNKIQLASFIVLLFGSLLFGFLGKATEMGLIITAGFLGLVFCNLDRISRFKGAGFEAEFREQIKAVIEKEIEPEDHEQIAGFKVAAYGTDDKAKAVIKALKNPQYTWRHLNGIIKESGVGREVVENTLKWLTSNNLGMKSEGPKGDIWSLNSKGRDVFSSIS